MLDNENKIVIFWDALEHGSNTLIEAGKSLNRHNIHPSIINYLIYEYIYENNDIKDEQGKSPKERISELTRYYEQSSVVFNLVIIPSTEMNEINADDIISVESSILKYIFPIVIRQNPAEIHIPLTSGTQSIRFAWISLYTKSLFTRSFGNIVHLWQKKSDRGSKKLDTGIDLYEINIDKNPFIDSIENEHYKLNSETLVNLDPEGRIKRNAAVDVPMLILGERGIGKSTLLDSTIVPEKKSQGYITKTEVQTIICGQLDSELAADELFGHKKGAFTGANESTKGKIELANNGILFLDEIQDLPRPIQRQLLRALQEKKFRKIGSKTEEVSDFRLVCASNNTLTELQEKLDPDFFDRIATFKSYIKPLREQELFIIEELWNNRWLHAVSKGFKLPASPDEFSIVSTILIKSEMKGNIRDIEQLIAYVARDVYQGTIEISDRIKSERYKKVLDEWYNDYTERYQNLKSSTEKINDNIKPIEPETPENNIKSYLDGNSWKDINSAFKKWLANTAIEYYGSRKNAAKSLHCEEKTLYNARE